MVENLNSDGDGVDGECYWQVHLFFIYFIFYVSGLNVRWEKSQLKIESMPKMCVLIFFLIHRSCTSKVLHENGEKKNSGEKIRKKQEKKEKFAAKKGETSNPITDFEKEKA